MSRPTSNASQRWPSIQQHHDSPTHPNSKRNLKKLPGGNKALGAFVLSLVAYTLQTECAQYVQQALNYRKPFLSLYLGHSGFSLLFPAHLAILCYTTKYPLSHYLHLISQNLRWQLRTPSAPLPRQGPDAVRRRLSLASGRGVESDGSAAEYNHVDIEHGSDRAKPRSSAGSALGQWFEDRIGFDAVRLFGLLGILTLGITVPALSWYSAVPMTSMADITAIYNTFSVWALVFSVWFLGEQWQKRKVFSVLLACFGVVVVAYGGAEHRKQPKELDTIYGKPDAPAAGNGTANAVQELALRALSLGVQELLPRANSSDGETTKPEAPSFSNPMLGNLLALVGAVTMAAYEMAFKLVGTLPDEEKQRDLYSAVGSAANRRSRSYVDYRHSSGERRGGGREAEGLLREEHGDRNPQRAPLDDERKHVLGDDHDDDEIDNAAPTADESMDSTARLSVQRAGERLSIWTPPGVGETDPLSYQTMTPPPEPASRSSHDDGGDDDDDGVPKKASGGGGGGGSKGFDGVTVKAKAVPQRFDNDDDGASEVTESELDDGEAEEIEHGAHRLRRNPSYASTRRASRIVDATYSSDEDDNDETTTTTTSAGRRPRPSSSATTDFATSSTSIPPPLPFGLHANLMTSGIGLVTLTCLWIGLPLSHFLGWEEFELPPNLWTATSMVVVVVCGIFFNAAFMILLSLWGPVLASVSCLMTTVLVEVADVVFVGREVKVASIVGCAFVTAGFAVLVGGGGEGLH